MTKQEKRTINGGKKYSNGIRENLKGCNEDGWMKYNIA